MKLLAYVPYANCLGHLETDLEVVACHREQGYEVEIITCNAQLPACDPNPRHTFEKCFECKAMSSKAWRAAGIGQEATHYLDLNKNLKLEIPKFKNVGELKAFSWQGEAVGEIAFNTLVMVTLESETDVTQYQTEIETLIHQFAWVYHGITQKIEQVRPDLFYVFNGRPCVLHAAYRAARRMGVNAVVGERNNYPNYLVLENGHATDLAYLKTEAELYRKRMNEDPLGKKIAEDWFALQRYGSNALIHNFSGGFSQNKLPEGFDPTKRNIAIYVSSEWECVGLSDWQNPLFHNQNEALDFIGAAKWDKDIRLYVRAHPFLKHFNNQQTRGLKQLRYPNLTLISLDADVDSYALMNACEKVITFGSTVGIESVYWEKPSILVGRSIYEDWDCIYNCKSKESLLQLIQATLAPKPREAALAYGYWYSQRVRNFKFVHPLVPKTNPRSDFQGVPLTLPEPARLALRGMQEANKFIHWLKKKAA